MEKISKIKSLQDLNLENEVLITTDVIFKLFENEINCNNTLIINENNYSENVKTFTALEKILNFFISKQLDRDQCVYVLGGGSIGDVCSLACSIYKRGINLINIPTTLLSCIDSSVGGKNAINLNGIKNVVGSFWPAQEIILVESIIDNFNDEILSYGKGEIFKYVLLTNNVNLNDLIKPNINTIYKCIEFKQHIVEIDPHDKNIRFCLNLGHSIGHVIESELKIPHGEAVSYGLYFEHLYLHKLNLISKQTFEEIQKLFNSFNLKKLDLRKINFSKKLRQDKKIKNKVLIMPYVKEVGSFDFIEVNIDNLIEVLCENI